MRGPIKYLDTAEWIHCTKRTKALLANKSAKKIKVCSALIRKDFTTKCSENMDYPDLSGRY